MSRYLELLEDEFQPFLEQLIGELERRRLGRELAAGFARVSAFLKETIPLARKPNAIGVLALRSLVEMVDLMGDSLRNSAKTLPAAYIKKLDHLLAALSEAQETTKN